MAKRVRIPGAAPETERAINSLIGGLEERVRKLEAKPGRAGVLAIDTIARVGEFLTFAAQSSFMPTCILPAPTQANRNGRVTISFRNANPVRLVCIGGTVNGLAEVINTAAGTVECICDGDTGWATDGSLSASGSANDATYHIRTAHGSLPNARVATASTSIDLDYATAGQVKWNPVSGFFTWAYVLSQGNNSGANNPHIDTSQYLGFGDEGSLPASGQIRSSANFEARATGSVTLTASTDIVGAATAEVRFNGPGGVLLEACASPSTSVGSADIAINTLDGGVAINAGAQQVAVTNGNVELRATNDVLINGVAGAALESCVTPSVAVATGDVVINAAGGIGIRAGAAQITSVSNGFVDIETTSNVEALIGADLIVNARSGINLNADAAATVTAVGGGVIALNAPTNGVAITAGLPEENLVGAGDVKINASSGVRLHAGATAQISASGVEMSSDTSIQATATTFWRAVSTTDSQIAAGSGVNIRAGNTTALGADDGDAVMQATGGIGLRAGTGTLGTITGAADGAIEASATGNISFTPGTFLSIDGESFLRFTEEAASTPALSAGQGLSWVRNDTPNVPMFTDDTNVDHVLAYRGEVGWDDVLAADASSGANNPIIANSQRLIFGTGGTAPSSGQIRAGNNSGIEIHDAAAGAGISLQAAGGIILNSGADSGTGDFTLNCAGDWSAIIAGNTEFLGNGQILIDTADAVIVSADDGLVVDSVGAIHLADESSAPATRALHGTIYVPTGAEMLIFMGDSGNLWRQNMSGMASMTAVTTRTNSTTSLDGATFSAGANSIGSGDVYRFSGMLHYSRGATATAANINIDLMVAGTSRAGTGNMATNTTNGYNGTAWVEGYLTCIAAGSSGTALAVIRVLHTIPSTTLVLAVTTSIATFTLNTTIANTLALRSIFSAAVANLSMTWQAAHIARHYG